MLAPHPTPPPDLQNSVHGCWLSVEHVRCPLLTSRRVFMAVDCQWNMLAPHPPHPWPPEQCSWLLTVSGTCEVPSSDFQKNSVHGCWLSVEHVRCPLLTSRRVFMAVDCQWNMLAPHPTLTSRTMFMAVDCQWNMWGALLWLPEEQCSWLLTVSGMCEVPSPDLQKSVHGCWLSVECVRCPLLTSRRVFMAVDCQWNVWGALSWPPEECSWLLTVNGTC